MQSKTSITREDILTSTGKKFLRHEKQLANYLNKKPHTLISAHISPEGSCNLNCQYCSVRNRKKKERIDILKLYDYLETLHKYGCKAIILTGGGEPMLYPHFDDLVLACFSYGFEVALITNGTMIHKKPISHYPFSWIRISVNEEKKWINSMFEIKQEDIHTGTRLGLSYVYDQANSIYSPDDLLFFAHKLDAKYMRLIPDCTGDNVDLVFRYQNLYRWLGKDPDPLFMVQHKTHGAPDAGVCHQAHFRPYLSEINGGTIFPCDSIPLNNPVGKFDMAYAIGDITRLEVFLKRRLKMRFTPREECGGCVFTRNVNLLEDIYRKGKFEPETNSIRDENFV